MKLNQAGINLIKEMEGLKLKAYKPVASEKYYTIGYGHYGADVTKDMVISQQRAEELLLKDLEYFTKQVTLLLKGTNLNDNQFSALVSFAYNLGVANLNNSTLLRKVKANPQDKTIANEFQRWVFASGRKLPGLERRRKAEAELYFQQH